jgi:hypothetical protein
MRPLHSLDQSMQTTPLVRNESLWSGGEGFSEADQFASRWEPDILDAHAPHADPYEAWVNEHQSERYSATGSTARSATGRFRRNQPPKASWEAIWVTLSPDGR